MSAKPVVIAVSLSPQHTFSKPNQTEVRLIAGIGVEGDAHSGATVQHLSRKRKDPNQPNLRQVHLLDAEILDVLGKAGFEVAPGQIGENITTRGVNLLALPVGARLRLGDQAIVEITGLRDPCGQLDGLQPGLKAALIERAADGSQAFKAGVMGVVLEGGVVRPGDRVAVELPPPPHMALAIV